MTGGEPAALWRVGAIFTAFAFNYFLSARAVVATLAPELARELHLGVGELAPTGGCVLGFARMRYLGAARGLFAINLSMLGSFMAWGLALPRAASGRTC
jgi:hypothetical protein